MDRKVALEAAEEAKIQAALEAARLAVSKLPPKERAVPRLDKKWPDFVRDLREKLKVGGNGKLGQAEFWRMFKVGKSMASKLESTAEDKNRNRKLNRDLMQLIINELGLHWSPEDRYGVVNTDGTVVELTEEGLEIFALITASDINPKDLKHLLQIHDYYLSRK